ncbi:hypothetical protein ELQ92_08500 [Labedella populi]|uniref:Pilus assembly protein n=1 Tax=Labedella populi TaxID=2498850 RepID=A0A3S4C1W0_9MICO|nr:hypothetical protein [Labedella populi]RWZ61078.1 hypothetical protein ELQ92_08500 [Labedella populi]
MPSVVPPSRRSTSDGGSASLEFIVAGLVLLVPIVYLVVTLSQIQSAVLAAEGGSRHAARLFVDAPDPTTAVERAEQAVAFALDDQGIDSSSARVTISCADDVAAECLDQGDTVTVVVRIDVALPLAPPVLDLDRLAIVPVEARSANAVSDFRVPE